MSENISYRNEVRRKLVHLSSLWIPLVMWFFPSRWFWFWVFLVMTLLSVAVEAVYAGKRCPVLNRCYDFFFHNMLRSEPVPGKLIISGGPYVLAAAALSLLCFPPLFAGCGMAVMLTGDTAAALIGRRYGKHKLVNGKSYEGAAAFVLTGCLVIFAVFAAYRIGDGSLWWAVFPAVTAGCFVELFEKQLKLDDNFSIPLVVALVLFLAL